VSSSVAAPAVDSRRAEAAAAPPRARLDSVDLLRGIVMVVMVIDHTRDYVHSGALRFDPTDLSQTTIALFFTRWITHYCAPVFVFLAGTGAYLQRLRGASARDVSRFLLSRGLWLIVLELTAVRVSAFFNVDYTFVAILQVIWVIGVSMIVLAALVHLPVTAIAAFGIVMVVAHNAFDGVRVPGWQGPESPLPTLWQKVWIVLHQGGGEFVPLARADGPYFWLMYPLIPWIGVMAAGYAFGTVYSVDAERRRRWLRRGGAALTLAFVGLRLLNGYGDPMPWRVQPTASFTILSFLNTTKYPPSLLFLLMTLGPSMIALAWFEGVRTGSVQRALVTFGRVPLFFYLLQWPLAHAIAVLLNAAAGKETGYLFRSPPALFTTAPPDAGFPLWVVYVCWAIAIAVLLVLCRWFAGVKRRSTSAWLRYL
jgi:uncharacterized membrane protein